MAVINSLNDMETIAQLNDTLYQIVIQMIGSSKSIKCVDREDQVVYTNSLIHLLSSMDIRNPVAEIFIKSLESFHATHGTGAKTFLFMICRFVKLVRQLNSLGINEDETITILNSSMKMLLHELPAICIPVEIEHSSKIDKNHSAFFTSCSTDISEGRTDNIRFDSNPEMITNFEKPKSTELTIPEDLRMKSIRENVYDSTCEIVPDSGNPVCSSKDKNSWGFFENDNKTDIVYLKCDPCKHQDNIEENDDFSWYFQNKVSLTRGDLDIDSTPSECVQNSQSKHLKKDSCNVVSVSTLGDIDQHDSDFEDCFEEIQPEKPKRENISSIKNFNSSHSNNTTKTASLLSEIIDEIPPRKQFISLNKLTDSSENISEQSQRNNLLQRNVSMSKLNSMLDSVNAQINKTRISSSTDPDCSIRDKKQISNDVSKEKIKQGTCVKKEVVKSFEDSLLKKEVNFSKRMKASLPVYSNNLKKTTDEKYEFELASNNRLYNEMRNSKTIPHSTYYNESTQKSSSCVDNSLYLIDNFESCSNNDERKSKTFDWLKDDLSSAVINFDKQNLKRVYLPTDAKILARGQNDLMSLVVEVWKIQKSQSPDSHDKLNLDQIAVVTLSQVMRESRVVPGLLVSCNTDVLSLVQYQRKTFRSLLLNSDLTHTYRHAGHVPLKKTLFTNHVAPLSNEEIWAANMVTLLDEFQIDAVLVKGNISNILENKMREKKILLFSNVSSHTLSVIGFCHKVSVLSYLDEASELSVCNLSLGLLDDDWVLKFHNKGFLHIDLQKAQTILLQHSTDIGVQTQEDSLWRCLYSFSNALQDKVVLPGRGSTELWCAKRLRQISDAKRKDANNESIVLEELSNIFNDFHFIVNNSESVCKNDSHVDNMRSKCESWQLALDTTFLLSTLDSLILTGYGYQT